MELLCEDFPGRALEGRDGGQRAGRGQKGKVITRAQPQPDPWEELGHGLHQLAPRCCHGCMPVVMDWGFLMKTRT